MNPERGQKVKLFFRNGFIEEGTVELWSDEKSTIRSLTGKSILIIQNTKTDIVAVKICFDDIKKDKPVEASRVYVDHDLQPEGYEKDPYLRWQKMADLKREIISMERENARKHLTTFKANSPMVTEYGGLPRRLQKPPAINTAKKN